jgi:hypothetical protein
MTRRFVPLSSRWVAQACRSEGKHALGDLGAPPGLMKGAMDALAREGTARGAWQEQRRGPTGSPVRRQDEAPVGGEHDVAVLAPLALLDADHHTLAIDVGDAEVGHLGHTEAAGVHGHEEGAVLEVG